MPDLNRFLSSLDAGFLYFEREKEPLHIGSCMVYQGRISKAELAKLLSERLHLVPRYRQRVVFPPFNVSHPLWADDPEFDVSRHLDEVEMEAPVTPEGLSKYAAEAYRGMLPRDRPLWSMTLLHGLPEGNTAVVWKVHHAMIDGVSGVDLTMVLNDFSAKERPREVPQEKWQPQPLPEGLSLLQESVQQRLNEVTTAATDAMFEAMRPGQAAERMRSMRPAFDESFRSSLRPLRAMPWNRPVSGELGFAWTELSFTELRQVKTRLGGTVNDLVLAILSGGLGRYLRSKDVKTNNVELRAMCPVSMRKPDEQGALGNLVSTMIAPLFVGIEDPLERLAAERKAMERLKGAGQAEAFYELSRLAVRVPPAWQAFAGRIPAQQNVFNTVSTNIPGPQIPLFQKGHKLLSWYPMGVVSNNIGLFIAILTYNQKITLGATVDPKLMPDVWELSGHLHAAYEELRAAAEVEPEEMEAVPFSVSRKSKGTTTEAQKKSGTKKPPARKKAKKAPRRKAPRRPSTGSKTSRTSAA